MFRRLIEGFKAWRRGEVRIAPHGSRGRIYARKADQLVLQEGNKSGGLNVPVRAKASLEMKITRADGTTEIRHVPVALTRKE